MPSPGEQISGMGACHPDDLPEGYQAESRGQACSVRSGDLDGCPPWTQPDRATPGRRDDTAGAVSRTSQRRARRTGTPHVAAHQRCAARRLLAVLAVMAAQWVGIVVSALLALVALAWSVVSQRQNRTENRRSNDLATKANEIARRALELAEQQATRYVPPWELTHAGGDGYRLKNEGEKPAHGVRIEGSSVHRSPVTRDLVDARSAVEFMAPLYLGQVPSDIVVIWHRLGDRSDEPQKWSAPLPLPKPREPTPPKRR